MRLVIRLDLGNDAFGDYPAPEVARILRRMADEADITLTQGAILRDINGNSVGTAIVEG